MENFKAWWNLTLHWNLLFQVTKKRCQILSASLLTYLLFPLCLRLAVDHKGNQFIDIFLLICDDFQLRNLSVGENVRHGNILR